MEFINEYHKLYERNRIWEKNTFLGVPMWKLPFDAFVIAELMYKVKPHFIIETGTGKGGSALFYAAIFELMGFGMVYTCDINLHNLLHDEFEWEDRISLLSGNSIDPSVIETIEEKIRNDFNMKDENGVFFDIGMNPCRGMVILDSWHSYEHVLKEMKIYKKFVDIGSYMVVEDTHTAGHPVPWEHEDGGPYQAVEEYLKTYDDFEVDWKCEKHLMTFNPKGYLRRVK